jgi:hypothetical protein
MKKSQFPLICLLLFCFIFSSCATTKQPLTREESLQLRKEQIEATTRLYKDVTPEEVLIAVDRLFRLADGDDFKIFHTENAIIANRRWSVYLIIAAGFGNDSWIVAAEENSNEKIVKVVVRVSTNSSPVIPMMTTAPNTWTVATLPGVESTSSGKALYFIFFQRLDYLLGKTNKWLDCGEAKEIIKSEKIPGNVDCLCNPFNITDLRPE